MNRLGIAGAILFTFFAFCGRPDLSEGTGGPRMVLKERDFNAGDVFQGKVIEHSFTILNRGEETLELKRVNRG